MSLEKFSVAPWYHVISKTVRGARLLCDGALERKQWIEDRLELLASVFAVEIGGFAILDREALLGVCAYIDLNVFAAGMAPIPEQSPHTSIRKRVGHCAKQGRLSDLQSAERSTVAGVQACQDLESNGLWLCPIEDQRHRDAAARPGLLDGFSLGSYLQLVDWTSRVARKGKAHVSRQVTALLKRLGTTTECWTETMRKLFNTSRHTGIAFAFTRTRLREAATQFGRQRLANLNGCGT